MQPENTKSHHRGQRPRDCAAEAGDRTAENQSERAGREIPFYGSLVQRC